MGKGGSLYTEHSFGRLKDYNCIVFDPFILGSDESIDSGGRGQEKGGGKEENITLWCKIQVFMTL